jgi:hypothetical protein
MEDDDDPISRALSSRRIPHGRSGKKGKGGGRGGNKPFDPLRALGRYDLSVGSNTPSKSRTGRNGVESLSNMWLELHELTHSEDGLLGTFNLEDPGQEADMRLSGMCALAGSRKTLSRIIEELEEDAETDPQPEIAGPRITGEQIEQAHGDGSDDDVDSFEPELDNRASAFEKNSFRTPKFWMRWNAQYLTADGKPPDASSSGSDRAYLVFSGNDCERFEGALTCSALGWDNIKLRGWKVRPKASRCPVSWTDFNK